ncbi:YheC/YheD family protein [Bacillus spongiae]|uniref:YheC/YheD family protein n=1 Tax=Bacillus spongiae TaxID=2683610 RepID=A0ABU8HB01_9BACI
MKKAYDVIIITKALPLLYYPKSVQPTSDFLTVCFGTNKLNIHCLPHPHEKEEIILSTSLANQLQIPKFINKLYCFVHEETISLGPLIGIFTSGFTANDAKPVGERTGFFQKLINTQEPHGIVPFLFGEQHINWTGEHIMGLFYIDEEWRQIKVPFPNVIYDRLPNRKSENRMQAQIIKARLQDDYLIPWYNPGFFNKLEIFERLFSDDSVESYLPETHPFLSFSQAEKMLAKYNNIFLKPKNGSLGIGIHQILYDRTKGNYFCRFRHQGENKLVKSSSLEYLYEKILQSKNPDKFLIQQGISLLRVEQSPIDFRIHVNKNEDGDWEVSAIAAKVAGSGSVTTHVHSGGEVKSLAEIFSEVDRRKYESLLKEAALKLAKSIEENTEGVVGEIGFDLGIDRQERVWMFEANSKPGRSIFHHPALKHFEYLTNKLALSYGIYLTEKAMKQHKELFL